MKRTKSLLLTLFTTSLLMPAYGHLSTAPGVDRDLQTRRSRSTRPEAFKFLENKELSGDRLEAMKFLYAYMLLPDLADHDADFYLANVDAALKARSEMPWGKIVPDREFLHFVLPIRINNEDLDMARPIFYEALKERVRNLSMEDAILEVNHWCHEQLSYQPSDGRTSSPLSAMSQAIGRCGEESTFAVAALRSVGIPARQVYTPRWAHTDDNHAWVEAWANGKWHYLGACEPAPVLDMAWFTAPASRGMLMTTNVFGNYDGPEEVLSRTWPLTTINVTANYAPVDTLDVRVVDSKGRAVKDATVNFCIFNYCDFYPAARRLSDSDGHASLTAGLGDMIVWASDGNNFGFAKGNPADDGYLTITLDKDGRYTGEFDLDIVPPSGSRTNPGPDAEMERANNVRLQIEDLVRNHYISSFATAATGATLASLIGTDSLRTADVISKARGNSRRLMDFLKDTPAQLRGKALNLLCAVSEKDLRDITGEVLIDHLATEDSDSPLYNQYILNPRIANEGLTPYKAFFASVIDPATRLAYRQSPSLWLKWVADNIATETREVHGNIAMSPRGVWENRRADAHSRDIFFVAGARSFGIPARIDPVTGKTQYAVGEEWIDVKFDKSKPVAAKSGKVSFDYKKTGRIADPIYYSQFALSRLDGGVPVLMEYDEQLPLSSVASSTPMLDSGQYLLLTGQRLADGAVMAKGRIFNVGKGGKVNVPVVIRQDTTAIQVIGSLNAENIYHDLATDNDKSILSTTGRGYFVVGIIAPGDEPSAHGLNEIAALADEYERNGAKLVMLFEDKSAADRFDFTPYASLPSTLSFGIDNGGVSRDQIVESLNLDSPVAPIFVIADSFNRIVFVSQGYTIGLGDKILDILSKTK